MKRAVNDVRGTVEARSGLNEVRVRNLLAPPYGPWFSYPSAGPNPLLFSPFSADPGGLTGFPPGAGAPFRPTTGPGITVVIDPLWMIQNPNVVPGTPETYRFGLCDLGNPPNGRADFYGGEGFYRTGGGIQEMAIAGFPTAGSALALAYEIFASPDDITFGEKEQRLLPLQFPFAGPFPPYLNPPSGVPFSQGTMFRECRYSWLLLARKVSASQVYSPGLNGVLDTPLANDEIMDNFGPDPGPDGLAGTSDDPGMPGRRILNGAVPPPPPPTFSLLPTPVGPFEITIVVFYNRDFMSREVVYANATPPGGQPVLTLPIPIFSPVPRTITIGPTLYGPYAPNEATLVRRPDVAFPEIPKGAYIVDTTFSGYPQGPIPGPRGGAVYKVIDKRLDASGEIMIFTLDQPARANGPPPAPTLVPPVPPGLQEGYVLTWLKGAVAVYEKQVP